jgi:hypothetical protein
MNKLVSGLLLSLSIVVSSPLLAKGKPFEDKFRQLDEVLPTPNVYRTASGAPGHKYWQQQADYKIKVKLHDDKQTLTASETINYKNNSPDTLTYLWLQLDQNRFNRDSIASTTKTTSLANKSNPKTTYGSMRNMVRSMEYDGGFNITRVAQGTNGRKLKHVINNTMMRIDLPTPLRSGKSFEFSIDWNYHMKEQKVLGGRAGYEYFKKDDNYLYEVAQWFPRMAAYYDAKGWQNKQFLGNGEFALEFGDYDVEITVPADHIVAATGELDNASRVLTSKQRNRLDKARKANSPVIIVSEEEAIENEKTKSTKTKTWRFKAENVRDFAWASSRKFIWDAQGYKKGATDTMAMSYYPKEGNPLWERYSTEAIVHTIEHYNKYSLEYPYPVSISVNGPVGGMEYPMITFNGPRPKIDKKTGEKTYSKRTKYGLIGVIIHEVGHNYYPMIVNSDERQWTWMDEGLNSFVEYLAAQAWEENYPSRRGPARNIVNYMKSSYQVPIMTNSESILQFGNNAYGKPATALNILRETIMGRELFDFAFKQYAERWKFKRPTPADFFRTMEDASAVDLDWFIRGWFYTTDHVDISLDKVTKMHIGSQDPEVQKSWDREQYNEEPMDISKIRNKGMALRTEAKPELLDFYNEHDKFTVTNSDRNKYNKSQKKLEDWQLELLKNGKNLYAIDFSNKGGLVMPIILQVKYEDGTDEVIRTSGQIWRKNTEKVSKLLITDKVISEIVLDPYWETADVDVNNNYWPQRVVESRLELYKRKKSKSMMEKFNQKLKTDEDDKEEKKDDAEKTKKAA